MVPMVLIPLHTRSRHSLGFGTASVEELAARAASLGLHSLAVTDIETMAGQIRFHDACAAAGIKPITGVELRSGYSRHSAGTTPGRLILLARDEIGYANLCRIVSRRRTRLRAESDDDPVATIGADASKAGASGADAAGVEATEPEGAVQGAPAPAVDGLFLLTDDITVLDRLLRMDTIDRESVRLLLVRPSPHKVEEAVRRAAQETSVPLVADLDLVTLDREDRALHTLLIAIRHGITTAEVRGAGLDSAAAATFDGEALARFDDVPRAVAETGRIADACTLDLGTARKIPPRLPELTARGGGDAASSRAAFELRSRCRAALARYEAQRAAYDYDTRLDRELATIERLGFADYFLAVAEIVRGARKLGVATAGRGSAAGSLVAFLLGITQIDPVEADLLFERFLHERREAPPDIDLDVASVGRDAVNAWVVRRFGRERVAGVATYASYRARSAVRTGLAALGMTASKVDLIARRLDVGEASGDEEAALVTRFLLGSTSGVAREAAAVIGKLVGIPSHISVHPGGIVIGDWPLERLVPLERASSGTIVTQFEHRAVERAGFLKIDLLGNHFLSEMQETLAPLATRGRDREEERADGRAAGRVRGRVAGREEGRAASLADFPVNDEPTWQTVNSADTIGCFQVESPAVRSVLRRLPMKEFSDLVAALAVVRPGAAAGAAKERYVRRARGEERFEPLEILGARGGDGDAGLQDRYPQLRARLARSRGVLLYDEDIIRLLSAVGAMSLSSADALRTAIVEAGEEPEELARLGAGFVTKAVAAGASRRVAVRAWEAASRFAAYSFAEAHAASYAVLAWQAAWLRTHSPLEFGCALLNHHRGLYPLRTIAAAVERWGVTLLPPSVNSSQLPTTAERGSDRSLEAGSATASQSDSASAARVGLVAIKGLSKRTARDIIAGRPFGDLGELIDSARPARRELRALLLSGACDSLPPLSPGGYPLIHEVVLEGVEGEASPSDLARAVEQAQRQPREGRAGEEFGRYQRLVRVRNEIRFLDMHLSDHPMSLMRAEAERLGCLPVSELGSRLGTSLRFAGLLAAARRLPTAQGELRFLTFEDETGLVEGVLFPDANVRLGERLTTPGPYLVQGLMRETDGDLNLVVTELMPFHERE